MKLSVVLFLLMPFGLSAQYLLNRVVSLDVHRMKLSRVLDSVGERGHFEFSYNSDIIRGDSLVTVHLKDVSVRDALERLLGDGYVYVEQGNFLIIQPAVERTYWVTGAVVDGQTGLGIRNATVYVKEQLQSTLTDAQGGFRIRLKVRSLPPVLTISKEWYGDTALVIHPGYDQFLKISISPVVAKELSTFTVSPSGLERSRWGKFFLTSKQRLQSLNLAGFFTNRTSQVSLVPWVGTHGKMSGQVTNALSLNIIGGYSAGVNGVELGSVFNIDRKDVQGVQVGGVVNIAGGKVSGVQAAGVLNWVVDSMKGVQIGGYVNRVNKNVTGVQVAGYANNCKGTLTGVQVAAIVNHAHVLRGVQIGIVNIADSSAGYSIGLVSIVKHGGVHQLDISTDAVTGISASYIEGNKNLNSIFIVGYNPWSQVYSYGYGIGKNFPMRRWGFYPEIRLEGLHNRQWKSMGGINRVQTLFTYHLDRKIQIFVGPSATLFRENDKLPSSVASLKTPDMLSGAWGKHVSGWIAITAGIRFF